MIPVVLGNYKKNHNIGETYLKEYNDLSDTYATYGKAAVVKEFIPRNLLSDIREVKCDAVSTCPYAIAFKRIHDALTKSTGELDSEMIYNIIDDEIAPLFYERDANGLSPKWISYIKNTIARVASNFTTNRMLEDYEKQYYVPMSARYQKMIENDFAMAAEIAEWKKKISREWDNIELVGLDLPNRSKQIIALGKSYYGEVKLEIGELSMHEVGVELVAAEQKDGRQVIREKHDFIPVEQVGSVARYRIDVTADSPGLLMLAIRIYPKSELLPHRQDFALVKWL